VIRAALQAGQVDPSTISALEMHGTGTSLGDPIEVGAAFAVLQPPADGAFAAGMWLHLHTSSMRSC
jgi:acyl transferase domain-containing protein